MCIRTAGVGKKLKTFEIHHTKCLAIIATVTESQGAFLLQRGQQLAALCQFLDDIDTADQLTIAV